MRPNYAQDAPPTTIQVGGFAYPVNCDYRVWVDITRKMQDFYPTPDSDEKIRHNVDLIADIETLAFGNVLEGADHGAVLSAIAEFAKGYPQQEVEPEQGKPRTFDYDIDLNWIVLAIRNQSGIDLSYRRTEPFHWWLFLLEFQSLCGDHYILRLMEIRGYTGTDKEIRRQQSKLAVKHHTAEEDDILRGINEEFYGAV